MELECFIRQTLSAILKGVQGAIEDTLDTKGVINPCWGDINGIGQQHVQEVKFDVAVTVIDKTTSSAGGGIKIAVFKVDACGAAESHSSHVSRIQFTVPIVPPVQPVTKPPNEHAKLT